MKSKKIAGVSIRTSAIKSVDYDTIFNMALNSPKYYLKKNAKELIAKELKENGILKSNTKKSKSSKPSGGGRQVDTKSEDGNSKPSQKPVAKGS